MMSSASTGRGKGDGLECGGSRTVPLSPTPCPRLQPVPWVSGGARHCQHSWVLPIPSSSSWHRGYTSMQRQLVGNTGSQLQDPQGQEGSRAPSYTAQACHIPALPAPIPDQGLTVGRLLWVNKLCRGAGQAGGQRCRCTGPIRVPGLTAVVAELGATSLTPTGEARTLGTAIGDDSVAVGRRQSAWGDQHCPQAPCHIPAQHTVIPLPRTDRLCAGRSQICVVSEQQPAFDSYVPLSSAK